MAVPEPIRKRLLRAATNLAPSLGTRESDLDELSTLPRDDGPPRVVLAGDPHTAATLRERLGEDTPPVLTVTPTRPPNLGKSELWLHSSCSRRELATALHSLALIATERRDFRAARALDNAALERRVRRAQVLLDLPRMAEELEQAEFLQRGLDLIEGLTQSEIAVIHFVDEAAETIELITWSQRTLREYCRAGFDRHYPIRRAGIWADAFRQRAPVVFNDYASYPHKHGLPEEHAHLERLISVPVIEGGQVKMLTGIGNKPTPYSDLDVETVQLIGEGLWRLVRQRRSDRELREAAHFRTLLFSHLTMGVLACNEEGRVTFLNEKTASLFGHDMHEDLGLEDFPFVDADNLLPLPPEHHPLQQALRGETLARQRLILSSRDQGPRLVLVSGGPLVENERQVGALIVITDITDQEKVEASLRLRIAALEAAANAIVITDREGRIEWANPAFTTLTGFTLGESEGRNPRELVKSGLHDRDFYKDLWDTVLAGRVWEGELQNRKKDGTIYPEALTITPVRNERGEVAHFIAVKRDLTEERRLREQLLQSHKMESVGRLAGGVAHDFNNLLTVINGMLELVLAELREEDPVRADLLEVRAASDRAAELTRQLLAFSRQQVMTPKAVNLNTMLLRLERMLRRLIGEDIVLHIDLEPGLDDVYGDLGQLEQVLVNLVANARDAMPLGGQIVIRTTTRHIEGAEGQSSREIVLSVSDTGDGIDPVHLSRIFEPFFTTKPVGRGTGLGLSTCHGIIAQSRGRIEVKSTLGAGTTFEVTLPVLEARPSTSGETPAPSTPHTRTATRLLLVDDEAGLRRVTSRLLKRAGYEVLTASNGEEALKVLAESSNELDLVITDVVMPGMSGLELVKHLKERHPGLKVLFTSGYTSDTLSRHGLSETELHFITKPYTIAALTTHVQAALTS